MMSYLTTIQTALSTALTAVSTRVGSLLDDEKRFPAEFYVPALTFYLACLAISMAIFGTEVPRNWWSNLSADLKLLAGVLAGLLLILLAEVSRSLVAIVRRLYSGEWPVSSIWKPFRKDWLREHENRADLMRSFSVAYDNFSDASARLTEIGLAPTSTAKKKKTYTVPLKRIPAYQMICPEDVQRKELDENAKVTGPVIWPEDIIGRYAVRELPAGEHVPAGYLRKLLNETYLNDDRRVVTISLSEKEAAVHMDAGDVVELWIKARGESQPQPYSDLFVMNRAKPEEIILSVPQPKIESLLLHLERKEALTFIRLSAQPTTEVTGIPVAKRVLQCGEYIQEKDLTWVKKVRDLAESYTQAYTSEEVLDHVYWTMQPDGTHPENTPFNKGELNKEMAQARWLLYEIDGVMHSRKAVRVGLDQDSKDAAGGKWLVTNEVLTDIPRNKLNEIAAADSDHATQMTRSIADPNEMFYIGEGDVLDLLLLTGDEGVDSSYSQCYVYRVVDGSNSCMIELAVKDMTKFQQEVQKSNKILGSPYSRIPMLKDGAKSYGQLIAENDLLEVKLRTRRIANNICTKLSQVVDHYVEQDRTVDKQVPILIEALGSKLPKGHAGLNLTQPENTNQKVVAEGRLPQRGDLVTLSLSTAGINGGNAVRIDGPWERILVRDVQYRPAGNSQALQSLTLVMPGTEKIAVEDAWKKGDVSAVVKVTHNDTLAEEALRDAGNLDPDPEQLLDKLNQMLSSKTPEPDRLVKLSEITLKKAKKLVELNTRLRERPWQGDDKSDTQRDFYKNLWNTQFWKKLLDPFRDAVEPWSEDVIYHLADQALKADQLLLPDKISDIKPTEMGNVLAAVADYPWSAYTIDTSTFLPRLVQVLNPDDNAYKRLRAAESSLNMVLMFSFWALLWTPLASVALLLGRSTPALFPVVLIGGTLFWWFSKEAATTQAYAYSDALKALFDLKRRELLDVMGVQLSEDEIAKGMTPQEEGVYWNHLYRLFALGGTDDPGFPKLKTGSGAMKQSGFEKQKENGGEK